MPFHVIETGDGKYNVENADTHEVKNKEPYRSKAKAQAYSNALNAHSKDTAKGEMIGYTLEGAPIYDFSGEKRGAMVNMENRGRIRSIRAAAKQIMDHTMAMVPGEMDEAEADDNPHEEMGEEVLTMAGHMDSNQAKPEVEAAFGKKNELTPEEIGAVAQDAEIVDLTDGPIFYEGAKGFFVKAPAKDGPDSDYLVVDKDGQHLRVKRNGKPDHGLMGGAWAALHGGYRSNKYEGAGKEEALHKLMALYKSEGMDMPDMGKSLNLAYVKSMGLALLPQQLAVKYVGRDEIKGYTFLWGDPQRTDIEREFFTPKTDFWDGVITGTRPLTWDHAQDDEMKATPVIGTITDFGDDELGRWYAAKLDRSHRYRKMIDKLIEQGVIGTSSDSAPQYVVRERMGKSTWLKRWPWFASALTDVPCEPRLIGSIEMLKSLGITIPDARMGEGEVPAAWAWDTERIRLSKLRT